MTTKPRYEVCLRPGCYTGVDAPVISRHNSLTEAVKVARKSDRFEVQLSWRKESIWHAPRRGDSLIGHGPQRGEPSIDESVREAAANERAILEDAYGDQWREVVREMTS